MKRFLDIILALILGFILLIPGLLIMLIIRSTSSGPALFWSLRKGQKDKDFNMPKFRSMPINTPLVATHLLNNEKIKFTFIGRFLRKTSLDELPQIWCIIRGEMSFVGPRPALVSQNDLIKLRNEAGVNMLKPGLTGWAQINGRDNLTIHQKVEMETEYLKKRTIVFDIKILFITFIKVLLQKNITH